jgi:hypothetical protein
MKPSPIHLVFAAAAFAVLASAANADPAGSPPNQGPPLPGTAAAFQCLVRQGPPDCANMFVGRATSVAQPWVFANSNRDFRRGAFVSGGYFGQAEENNVFDQHVMTDQPVRQMDIYDAKFEHFEWTFYIGPANEDGKINALAVRLYGPHDLNQLHR